MNEVRNGSFHPPASPPPSPQPCLAHHQPRLPQVFAITPGLHLVDWRRGAGDVVAYHKFYEAMRLRLGDMVAAGNPAGHPAKAGGEQEVQFVAHAGSRQPLATV